MSYVDGDGFTHLDDPAEMAGMEEEVQAIDAAPCRECGCTWDKPCVEDGQTCSWIEPDLCSFCAEKAMRAAEAAGG